MYIYIYTRLYLQVEELRSDYMDNLDDILTPKVKYVNCYVMLYLCNV